MLVAGRDSMDVIVGEEIFFDCRRREVASSCGLGREVVRGILGGKEAGRGTFGMKEVGRKEEVGVLDGRTVGMIGTVTGFGRAVVEGEGGDSFCSFVFGCGGVANTIFSTGREEGVKGEGGISVAFGVDGEAGEEVAEVVEGVEGEEGGMTPCLVSSWFTNSSMPIAFIFALAFITSSCVGGATPCGSHTFILLPSRFSKLYHNVTIFLPPLLLSSPPPSLSLWLRTPFLISPPPPFPSPWRA